MAGAHRLLRVYASVESFDFIFLFISMGAFQFVSFCSFPFDVLLLFSLCNVDYYFKRKVSSSAVCVMHKTVAVILVGTHQICIES